jgi:hypothetical protein
MAELRSSQGCWSGVVGLKARIICPLDRRDHGEPTAIVNDGNRAFEYAAQH